LTNDTVNLILLVELNDVIDTPLHGRLGCMLHSDGIFDEVPLGPAYITSTAMLMPIINSAHP
jgi:hypothetical protein